VDHANSQFSNETYLQGLLNADEPTLQNIYSEFRQPIVRSLTHAGASEAAGAVFFQTALQEVARQARQGEYPDDIPFYYQVKSLAWAHYTDWLTEHNQAFPLPEPEVDEPDTQAGIPSAEQLRETRKMLLAWRRAESTENPYPEDRQGLELYQKTRVLERRIGDRQPITGEKPAKNRILTYVIVGLAFSLIGLFAYRLYNRTHTPAEVYKSNFNPPKSILEDIQRLNSQNPPEEAALLWTTECTLAFEAADELYKQKQYNAAAQYLLEIADSEVALPCQSDALFYTGIIGLQLERPNVTLRCFTKIDNLERYGEDLYWYQALAFVKLASKNAAMHEKAAGALERARSNTQDPERREQAERMLKELQ
jgi:hypothetical protein